MKNLALLNCDVQNSFDPLDADFSNNRLAMKLLYSTPIEISSSGLLTSDVLSLFSYDSMSKKILLQIEPNAKYSDGSAVTIDDIRIAILRMALKRPYFPVLKRIVGIEDWLLREAPLLSSPSGVRVDKDTLTIELSKNQRNALFRLTLEVFSVIPQRCIDLRTCNLNNERPPFSGNYRLVESKKNHSVFERRFETTKSGDHLPRDLKISYISASQNSQALYAVDDETILSGWEASLANHDLRELSQYEISWLPRAWFTTLILNPNAESFREVKDRVAFAEIFRRNFSRILKTDKTEASQLTSTLPGYMTTEELMNSVDIRPNFSGSNKINLATSGGGTTPFKSALANTLRDIGQEEVGPLQLASYNDVLESFTSNETAILGYSSGFWEQDPVGDLQMYLTPKLHPVLNFITADVRLQQMLDHLDDIDGDELVRALKEINVFLFSNAVSNVVAHVRKFYLTKGKSLLASHAMSQSNPAPWQLFSAG